VTISNRFVCGDHTTGYYLYTTSMVCCLFVCICMMSHMPFHFVCFFFVAKTPRSLVNSSPCLYGFNWLFFIVSLHNIFFSVSSETFNSIAYGHCASDGIGSMKPLCLQHPALNEVVSFLGSLFLLHWQFVAIFEYWQEMVCFCLLGLLRRNLTRLYFIYRWASLCTSLCLALDERLCAPTQ